ncbi:entericidin EcnA/B family protein [Pseudoprimorskyibacter insulae]|uniref:Entericidin EcnA/B family protein n=1 Tax=Pseudoprimorskyibacter insulae TaxID=1695997 RepID=A0A2R8AZ00_9RHOB|nr:entericidin EcnA/B family protein [Pseudoprimorskyibacter insulae]SPF81258.1 hypothetical protein PRI8871_03080 [Pseudoprimorskyibacter insulae]
MTLRVVALIAASVLLVGCSTVEGIGQDISGGARTVRNWF